MKWLGKIEDSLQGYGSQTPRIIDAAMGDQLLALCSPTSAPGCTERQAAEEFKASQLWGDLDRLNPRLSEGDLVALYADGIATPGQEAAARLSQIELTAATHSAASAAPARRSLAL